MQGEHVLIVDDDKSFLEGADDYLSKDGIRVHTATSAREAIWVLGVEAIDSALLDLRLPPADGAPTDGIDVAEVLIAQHPGLPVSFLSGFPMHNYPEKATRRGIRPAYWLQKPVPLDAGRRRIWSQKLRATAVWPEFDKLANDWKKATAHHSTPGGMFSHPGHLRIIGLGLVGLPLILRDLATTRTHWFSALTAITGHDPVPAKSRGDMEGMVAAWIEWAQAEGIACD